MSVTQEGNVIIVELEDGTVVKHYYHVCPTCTSVDTWIVGPKDPENRTGDPCRRTVRGFGWLRSGGRNEIAELTTFTHVLDKEAG